MPKEAEIKFTVQLDDDGIPEAIYWDATDAEFKGKKPCECVMISIWDKQEKNTLGIDLWTKKMEVGEMNAHFYLAMMRMAETYERATQNIELTNMIKDFAHDFGKRLDQMSKD